MSRPTGARPHHIVVVGAGLAGARTCEQLRRTGYEGRLTLVGAERHAPYDRPPLSKAVLMGRLDASPLRVDFDALDVAARLTTTATGLRVDDRVVETTSGDLAYDGLVIATGANPIRLPGSGEQHTLRTIDDALRLRDALRPGANVIIVGASWIGAEVATAALGIGCRVTCVEAGPTVANVALGEIGERLVPWWNGVELRFGAMVDRVENGAVLLVDGTELPADVVVVGVGVRPATAWLADSTLRLDRGVVVDSRLAASPGVVAVGDVASWWSRRFARRMWVEHWDNAAAAPAVAAATLLDLDAQYGPVHDPVPYFWSDQFGHKLQYVGAHDAMSRAVVRTAPNDRWSVVWLDGRDTVTAMLVVDSPRDLVAARRLIMDRVSVDPNLIADGSLPLADSVVAHQAEIATSSGAGFDGRNW
jgi:3-phenylpropionate/trans-cinnamate dioxygenase ferredoxin reductase subunit